MEYLCSMSYTQTVKLRDDESLAKIQVSTGEIIEVPKKVRAIPEGKIKMRYEAFHLTNDRAMELLWTLVSPEEYAIVGRMATMADFRTNNLKPLNDETSIRELSRVFNINKARVGPMLKRLFDLGVYANVKVVNGTMCEYWVLNPYISFKGQFVDESLASHFNRTIFSKV